MNKQYGDFIKGKNEFLITERDIPRNWYNYLWNEDYVSFVSQTGAGNSFWQDRLSRRIHLVDERAVYLLENGMHRGITGLPVDEELDGYSCVHGHGYTVIKSEKDGISSEVCFFVPDNEKGEIWNITLTNNTQARHELRLLAYSGHIIDGAYSRQCYNTAHSYFDEAINGVVCPGEKYFDRPECLQYIGFMAMNERPDGYDAAHNAFIGPYDSISAPKALKRGGCSSVDGIGEKLCFALQKDIVLEPGESKEIPVICAIAFSKEEALEIKQRYNSAEKIRNELQLVKDKFRKQVEYVTIKTPDEKLNEMFGWLKHQSNLGARWARVRSNGYRDMLSDTDCLAAVNPELAAERLMHILTYQYSNGYSPRNIFNGINDNNFSDNTVWITFTAASVLKELGDVKLLDRVVEFNDGSEATVYEHIKRSVEFLYNFRGLHNLIKIWGGDWNDCMDKTGINGRGVSVWLSIAWYRANKTFMEIARIYGREDDAAVAQKRAVEMRGIIEEYGWDGEYYLDAYNDDDRKIGSHECEEGKMFLIPQIWAVLSGVSDKGREVQAMEACEKYLSSPLGTRISYPAYSYYDAGIGYVTIKSPGIHENGGIYLHTIAWKIAADALLKRADWVEKDIETILPFRNKVVDGRAEPYIMCNSYFGDQTGYRYGTPGQSWRTAAGQWFEKALINYVFGLMPEMEGLSVRPCLPTSWKTASITKVFRNATYNISYVNNGTNVDKVTVDGKVIASDILPYEENKAFEVVVYTK